LGHVTGSSSETLGHVTGSSSETLGHVTGSSSETLDQVTGSCSETLGQATGSSSETLGQMDVQEVNQEQKIPNKDTTDTSNTLNQEGVKNTKAAKEQHIDTPGRSNSCSLTLDSIPSDNTAVSNPEHDARMLAIINTVVPYVHFTMMSPSTIAKLLPHPLVLRFKEFFVPRMAAAVTYQTDANVHNGERSFESYHRVYTEEKWRTSFEICRQAFVHRILKSSASIRTPSGLRKCRAGNQLEWNISLEGSYLLVTAKGRRKRKAGIAVLIYLTRDGATKCVLLMIRSYHFRSNKRAVKFNMDSCFKEVQFGLKRPDDIKINVIVIPDN